MDEPHIYGIIIGSEILNGRRADKHFEFLKTALAKRGHTLYSLQIVKDERALIKSSFENVLNDASAVLFSFGGIGSTPDDLTREVAAEVFTEKPLVRHKGFENDVIERFGEAAFPHRVRMADLPEGAGLLRNPVNNMSGFYLQERYFFTPGFPEMAHPMVEEAITRFLPSNRPTYRRSLLARCSEERFIDLMQRLPDTVECSALPMFVEGKANVEMSVASYDEEAVKNAFMLFTDFLETQQIDYEVR